MVPKWLPNGPQNGPRKAPRGVRIFGSFGNSWKMVFFGSGWFYFCSAPFGMVFFGSVARLRGIILPCFYGNSFIFALVLAWGLWKWFYFCSGWFNFGSGSRKWVLF